MNILGIRARPSAITFAVIDSERRCIVNVETFSIPKALQQPEALKYVRNTVLDILDEYDIQAAGIRITEISSLKKDIKRIEIEGVIQESFASSSIKNYYCGQISNITARIDMDRSAFKDIVDGTKDFPAVENWSKHSKEEREAILCGMGAIKC